MQKPTMGQQAYINDLYNRLDVGCLQRQKPETIEAASVLINELIRQTEEQANQPESEENGY